MAARTGDGLERSVARYDNHGHCAVITMNRPSVLNAVNAELSTRVGELLEHANTDPEVRCVVVTGAGRAFCAGADLTELAAGRSVESSTHPEWGFAGLSRHWSRKPVIAAVNGYAMGGGTEIVLSCDLAVAGESAVFGLPEVKRGLIATAGGTIRLQRQVPFKVAMEIALAGRQFSAAEAARWALVNEVVPDDQVVERALALAEKIAANAPLAVPATRQLVHRTTAAGSDWETSWRGEDAWILSQHAEALVFATADAQEGAQAFLDKREPQMERTLMCVLESLCCRTNRG